MKKVRTTNLKNKQPLLNIYEARGNSFWDAFSLFYFLWTLKRPTSVSIEVKRTVIHKPWVLLEIEWFDLHKQSETEVTLSLFKIKSLKRTLPFDFR